MTKRDRSAHRTNTSRLASDGAGRGDPVMSNAFAPADRTQGERARMTQTARMTSGPQRLRALERANEVRLARAALKRRIAQGQVSAATVILDVPWETRSWA